MIGNAPTARLCSAHGRKGRNAHDAPAAPDRAGAGGGAGRGGGRAGRGSARRRPNDTSGLSTRLVPDVFERMERRRGALWWPWHEDVLTWGDVL